MRTAHKRLLAPGVAGVLLLATACSGAGDDPAAGTSETSVTPSRTGTTPSSAPSAPRTEFAGLELERLPTPTGRRADALDTYVNFERGLRETLLEARMSKALRRVSAPNVVAQFQRTVDFLRSHDQHYAGTARVTVDEVAGRGRVVVLEGCADGSDVSQVTGGKHRPVDKPVRALWRATLTENDGQWLVTEYGGTGIAC